MKFRIMKSKQKSLLLQFAAVVVLYAIHLALYYLGLEIKQI